MALLHGLGLDRRMWGRLVPSLVEAGHRVVSVDLPGHGNAARPEGPGQAWSVADLAGGVRAALEEAGARPAALVGFSLGGAVALELALTDSARVGWLALVDTSAWWGPEAAALFGGRAALVERAGVDVLVQPAIERWFTSAFIAGHPEVVARCVRWLRDNDPAGYAAACRALATFDARSRLRDIRCPTLVVVADQDQATTQAMARVLADGVPGAELRTLGPSGHLVTEECPRELEEVLLSFLGRMGPRV